MSPDMRMWRKCHAQGDCLVYSGYLQKNGYVKVRYGGRGSKWGYGHRLAYEVTVGVIPEDYTIDHLCYNKACVNPEHLEAVTMQENLARRRNIAKTHCKNGHELTPANKYICRSQTYTACRACHNLRQKRYYLKRRSKVYE